MLSDTEIHDLVDHFYGRIRGDEVLGPIFRRHVTDWPAHLSTMEAFWSSVANTSGRYKGNPMRVHMQLAELQPTDFGRWLELFKGSATATLRADGAALVINRAERIAESFKLGLGFYRNQPLQGH
jgi:hemoglobin